MRPSNEELQQLDRDLDDLHREMIVIRREEFERDFLQRYHSSSLMCQQEEVKSPTSDPFGDIWGRTRSFYQGTPRDLVNSPWGVPSALAMWDLRNISIFARDIGGLGTKIRHSVHQGRQYIILTGYPGLRRKLSGTRYGLRNAKIIEIGLGKYGIRGSSVTGFKLSCYVAVGVEVVDWIFRDERVLSDLLGGVGVELIKAGIATAVGYAAAMIAGSMLTFAAAPVIAGAFVVFVVGIGLNTLDSHYGIKERVKSGVRYAFENLESITETVSRINPENLKKHVIKTGHEITERAIDHIYDETRSWIIRKIQPDNIGLPLWPETPRLPPSPAFPNLKILRIIR